MIRIKSLSIYRVVPDVQEHNFRSFLVEKFKKDPVSLIYRETPLLVELAMQLMRIETRIKRIMPEKLDMVFGQPLQLRIQMLVAAPIARIDINRHDPR